MQQLPVREDAKDFVGPVLLFLLYFISSEF